MFLTIFISGMLFLRMIYYDENNIRIKTANIINQIQTFEYYIENIEKDLKQHRYIETSGLIKQIDDFDFEITSLKNDLQTLQKEIIASNKSVLWGGGVFILLCIGFLGYLLNQQQG